MSVYMSYCAECGEKLHKVRVMTESSGLHYGCCQGCFRPKSVKQYEIGPSWEDAARQSRRARAGRPKPGERGRDG